MDFNDLPIRNGAQDQELESFEELKVIEVDQASDVVGSQDKIHHKQPHYSESMHDGFKDVFNDECHSEQSRNRVSTFPYSVGF